MELENLLRHSLQQYRQLLEKLAEIGQMLKNGQTEAIGAPLKSWLLLQSEAQQTDVRIGELRERNPAAGQDCPFFEARKSIMENLAVQCRNTFSQANTHKALIRDELLRLRGGRVAINGYKPVPAKPGNRIGSRH